MSNPFECRIKDLADYYVKGPTFYSKPQPAFNKLTASKVAGYLEDATFTIGDLKTYVTDRIAEIKVQETEADGTILPTPFGDMTLKQVVDIFAKAGAVNVQRPAEEAVLPAPQSDKMGDLQIKYDLQAWKGGVEAYKSCGMENRIQSYAGTCYDLAGDVPEINNVKANVTCEENLGNETWPWSCNHPSTGAVLYALGAGDGIGDIEYRLQCELPCDLQADCNAICVCEPGCGDKQVRIAAPADLTIIML